MPKSSSTVRGSAGSQIQVDSGHHAEQHRDRDDDLGDLLDVAQALHQDLVAAPCPISGPKTPTTRTNATERRQTPRHGELPVQERSQHRLRAVGEVEDARGGVGQDQARRRDGVDGAEHQSEDRVGEELLHRV